MKMYRALGLVIGLIFGGVFNAPAPLMTWTASPNQQIPDAQPDSGLLSTITLGSSDFTPTFGSSYWIQDLDSIKITVTGGWNGDYRLVLSHLNSDLTPQASVELFNRMGVDGSHPAGYANAGFNNTEIRMGSTDISTVGSHSSTAQLGAGPYSPQGSVNFHAFANADPRGIWALYFTDKASGEAGTLTGWSLSLDVVPEPVNVALGIFGVLVGGASFARWWSRRRAAGAA
jgi:hypothetical protein